MMRSQFWFELGQTLTPIYSLSFTSPQKPIERFLTISDGPGWLLGEIKWQRSEYWVSSDNNASKIQILRLRCFMGKLQRGVISKRKHPALHFFVFSLHGIALVQSCAFRFWGLTGCGKNGGRWSVSKDSLNFIAAKETKWKYPALCCCIAAL